ncbi:hypothetical protein WJX72_000504 [[Myrmecia] bisecta]|uniref:Uncharacterized protein n=1 Tax=[Myrmecia] bisecta TaxID=41462 RepID=A0AAW1QNW5_9CHLO
MEPLHKHARSLAPALQPVISCNALSRARTTIEDFVQSYFPLHGLVVPQDFWRFWDILVFVEAVIYEMDEENEALSTEGQTVPDVVLQGEEVLLAVLRERGLLSSAISEQLQEGRLYWQSERDLCARMLRANPAAASAQPPFSVEEVHAASLRKSFDYRVLNLLLYNLTDTTPDRALLDFLYVDEHLVDIGDDLVDYEDDIEKNSFNIFRAYVHIFGKDAPLHLAKRISEFEALHHEKLQQLPQAAQNAYHNRRKQASAVPGSEKWVFPKAILYEAEYRST